MKVQRHRFVKTNGIKALLFLFAACLSTVVSAGIAMPVGNVIVQLLTPPAPPTLTIHSLPVQNAQANSDFKFHLKPYINGRVDIRYLVTSLFQMSDGTTTNISAANRSITGLPSGLTQITDSPDDCPTKFRLSYGQRCHLHLSLDTDNYLSTEGSHGPIISMSVSWNWEGHRASSSGTNWPANGVLPIASQRISAIVSPILWPTQLQVRSDDPNGLHYDSSTQSIIGKPTKPGIYHFQMGATNGYATAAPRDIEIHVSINPKDKPIFNSNSNNTVASAMAGQTYRLNLMDLILPTPGFMVTNQVSFRIDTTRDYPSWLSLDETDPAILQGYVSPAEAGKMFSITLIASSNSGGDSEPFTIQIPVAYDPAKKPSIERNIELTGIAGAAIHKDLRDYSSDPTNDNSLKIIIDNIEPAAPWLSISSSNSTELEGVIPKNAIGHVYRISLHANSAIGGNSETIIIPLKIATNEKDVT